MVLKENEICVHSNTCPYNIYDSCMGAKKRDTMFSCNYITEDGGFISDGKIRNKEDVTGNMEILLENVI